MIGAYAVRMTLSTVAMMLAFGGIGYVMAKANIPRAPVVLALVLAPLMESSLRQSLILSCGSLDIFVTRPIAAVLLVAVVLSLAWPFVDWLLRRRRAATLKPR